MFPYFVVPAVIVCACLLNHISRANVQRCLLFIFIVMLLFSSLRDPHIGRDGQNYIDAYNSISRTGTYYMEQGFVYLNRLISKYASSFFIAIFIFDMIYLFPLYMYISKFVEKEYRLIAVWIVALQPYMYLQTTFNVMRQACAIGIILVGFMIFICEVEHNHIISGICIFLGITFLATLFHRSALCALVIIAIYFIKWTKIKWRILCLVCLVLNILDVQNLIGRTAFLLGYARNKFTTYEDSLLNNPIYLFGIIMLILIISEQYDQLDLSNKNRKFADIFMFSLCFLTFAVSNDMVYRVYIMLAVLALPGAVVVYKT